jgi:hypothetical protein
MADDVENADPADVATEDLDGGLSHREVPKWLKSGGWSYSILIALPLLYFLIYPLLATIIYRSMGMPHPVPALLEKSVDPIEWVGDRIELYQNYTRWLARRML